VPAGNRQISVPLPDRICRPEIWRFPQFKPVQISRKMVIYWIWNIFIVFLLCKGGVEISGSFLRVDCELIFGTGSAG